ncbi:MAG: hypothetical protein KC586_05715, partial [Myxococcales bacterium]|nr:hypothetical protein [Myxococcales bacterium]
MWDLPASVQGSLVARGPMTDDACRALWPLEPGLAFLNHGSFGACPFEVLEAQTRLRLQMEREPVRFFVREL